MFLHLTGFLHVHKHIQAQMYTNVKHMHGIFITQLYLELLVNAYSHMRFFRLRIQGYKQNGELSLVFSKNRNFFPTKTEYSH